MTVVDSAVILGPNTPPPSRFSWCGGWAIRTSRSVPGGGRRGAATGAGVGHFGALARGRGRRGRARAALDRGGRARPAGGCDAAGGACHGARRGRVGLSRPRCPRALVARAVVVVSRGAAGGDRLAGLDAPRRRARRAGARDAADRRGSDGGGAGARDRAASRRNTATACGWAAAGSGCSTAAAGAAGGVPAGAADADAAAPGSTPGGGR